MRAALTGVVLVAAVWAGLARVDASTGPIPLKCDRACLEKVMDQYLAAVVAHDPKGLPLSADVKYTENNQEIPVGDGFWKTAQGIGSYKHYFADPEFGQVAFMGTMMEAGAPLLMSVRLRIELGRIPRSRPCSSSRAAAGPTTSRRWTRAASRKTSGSSRYLRPSGC